MNPVDVNVFRTRLTFTEEGTVGSRYDAEKTKAMLEAQAAMTGMEATVEVEEVSEEEKEAFLAFLKDSGQIAALETPTDEAPSNVVTLH